MHRHLRSFAPSHPPERVRSTLVMTPRMTTRLSQVVVQSLLCRDHELGTGLLESDRTESGFGTRSRRGWRRTVKYLPWVTRVFRE
jgi:hypothetical protein